METVERHNMWSVVIAPFTGLAYVVVLPFVAIGTVSGIVIKRVAVKMYRTLATLASFGWRPMEAYLTGKKASKKKEG
jgi:hypothetical protein